MEQDKLKEKFLEDYDAYGDGLFRFVYAKTSSRDMAEDFVQETYMRYWRELSRGKTIEYERAFLYRVTRNLIIDWYRKKKELSLDRHEEETGLTPGDESYKDIEHGAEAERVLELMNELSPQYREVVFMRYVEEIPPRDIAKILGESVNAVSTRISRARQELENLLTYGE